MVPKYPKLDYTISIMRNLLVTFCLVGVISIGASSTAEASDYPKYDGEISPIYKPMLLRNRPHPSSKWSIRATGSFSFGKEKIDYEQSLTGKTKVIQSASSIVQMSEIDDFQHTQIKGHKFPDLSIFQTFLLKLTMTPGGQYQKIDVESSKINFTNEDKNKIDQISAPIINVLNSIFKSLPQNGISENHEFFNINEPELDLSDYIPTVSGIALNISYRGIAIGVAQYGGRQVIVIKKSGKISIDEIRVENISYRNVRIKLNGYALMDTYTGRWILNETLMEGHGKLGELDVFVESRETGELYLHASTPKHKYSSKVVSTKMSLQEAKEECAELGFQKGTKKYGDCVMKLYN